MKVLIIDNYDSFTYNLYQYLGELLEDRRDSFRLDVVRNDERSFEEIRDGGYDRIVISPGPGHPADPAYFGVSERVLRELGPRTPLLGVCLGMQGIAHVFGGEVVRAHLPMHGKTSPLEHDGKGVFRGIPQGVDVMRYHSLVVTPESLPSELEITARAALPEEAGEGFEIMGLRHKEYPVEGIQFHPESFATEEGMRMLENFLDR